MLTLNQISDAARKTAAKYPNIKSIMLFGSYADNSYTPVSDVDLLVKFNTPSVSLLTLSAIKNDISELLNTEVDIIHYPLPESSVIEINKVVPLYAA